MNIQVREVSKRTIALVVLLILTLVGALVYKQADDGKYIIVKEYHVYEVKTPMGSLRKEIRTEKRFDGGEQMSEAYLQPPETMKEK